MEKLSKVSLMLDQIKLSVQELKIKHNIDSFQAITILLDNNEIPRDGFTAQEIAYILDIPKDTIDKIEAKAIKKIMHPVIGKTLRQYIKLPNADDIKYTGHE